MEIVAAESISQAVEMLTRKPRKAIRDFCVVLPEKLDDFLYDFRESFKNYQTFYQFDPYGEVFLPAEAVSQIKVFSDSVVKWAEENSPAENKVIETYGISLKKSGSLEPVWAMCVRLPGKMDMVWWAWGIDFPTCDTGGEEAL